METEHGLARTAGGLYVPAGHVPKQRVCFTEAQANKLRRVLVAMRKQGLGVLLTCSDPRCRHDPLVGQTVADDGSKTLLVCGHREIEIKGRL